MDKAQHQIETYKSMITISVEGIKVLFLINGGAIVALLGFLGSKTAPLNPVLKDSAHDPLLAFVIGVASACLAFVSSYLTQYSLFNESVIPRTYKGPRHQVFLLAGLVLFLVSIIAFIVGCYQSLDLLG